MISVVQFGQFFSISVQIIFDKGDNTFRPAKSLLYEQVNLVAMYERVHLFYC